MGLSAREKAGGEAFLLPIWKKIESRDSVVFGQSLWPDRSFGSANHVDDVVRLIAYVGWGVCGVVWGWVWGWGLGLGGWGCGWGR